MGPVRIEPTTGDLRRRRRPPLDNILQESGIAVSSSRWGCSADDLPGSLTMVGLVQRRFETGTRVVCRPASPVPSRKRSGQCRGALHLNSPGTQGVAPLELSEMPAGEGNGIIDHDDQVFFATWILQAKFGVTPFDQQPASRGRTREVGVVEADEYPALGEAVVVQPEGHPHPQHYARMSLFGLQFRPPRSPTMKGRHDFRKLAAGLGGLVGRTRAVGLWTDFNHSGSSQLP